MGRPKKIYFTLLLFIMTTTVIDQMETALIRCYKQNGHEYDSIFMEILEANGLDDDDYFVDVIEIEDVDETVLEDIGEEERMCPWISDEDNTRNQQIWSI